jgi:hypothetical protein
MGLIYNSMSRTNLEQFKNYCNESTLTIEELEANQNKYDYVHTGILHEICQNPKLTNIVFEWLLLKFQLDMVRFNGFVFSPLYYFARYQVLTIEKISLLIDFLISVRQEFSNIYAGDIFRQILFNKTFNASILNYLYQKDRHFDIQCEYHSEISPLYWLIHRSDNLTEIIQIIKSHEHTQSRTNIRTKFTHVRTYETFVWAINSHAENPDKSTICALVGLCGELFPLIQTKYLTQDICTQFYSSKYFQCNSDQESLIKLIPKQFQTNLLNINSRGRKTKPALRVQLDSQ